LRRASEVGVRAGSRLWWSKELEEGFRERRWRREGFVGEEVLIVAGEEAYLLLERRWSLKVVIIFGEEGKKVEKGKRGREKG
jgi:hypothetical protein